jgi:hypothetical protein
MGRTADYFHHEFVTVWDKSEPSKAFDLKIAINGLTEYTDVEVFPVVDGEIQWSPDGSEAAEYGVKRCYGAGPANLPKLPKSVNGYLIRHHNQHRQASVDERLYAKGSSLRNFTALVQWVLKTYQGEFYNG